jgi:hypothetical protein
MKKNVGTLDRMLRFVFAIVVAVLYATGVIGGAVAIGLGIVAAVLVFTGLVGWCGLYTVLGISTVGKGGT